MPRKVKEPEVEVSIGPVKSKMSRSTACCLSGLIALIGCVFFYNAAYGYVPGFKGFVLKSDYDAALTDINSTFNTRMTMILSLGGSLDRIEKMVSDNDKATRALILTGQINTAQRAYCAAVKAGDYAALSLAGDQVTQYQITYLGLTGEDFPLKPCQ